MSQRLVETTCYISPFHSIRARKSLLSSFEIATILQQSVFTHDSIIVVGRTPDTVTKSTSRTPLYVAINHSIVVLIGQSFWPQTCAVYESQDAKFRICVVERAHTSKNDSPATAIKTTIQFQSWLVIVKRPFTIPKRGHHRKVFFCT